MHEGLDRCRRGPARRCSILSCQLGGRWRVQARHAAHRIRGELRSPPPWHFLTDANAASSRAGPSAEARLKGIRKRQLRAGTALNGGAAKNDRRSQLKQRGVPDDAIEDLVATVGLPGAYYLKGGKLPKLPALSGGFEVRVVQGEG